MKFKDADLFDTPSDLAYVQDRIARLAGQNRAEWVAIVDQLTMCANPRHGMRVTDEARIMAKAKLKELGARNRRTAR